MLQLNFASYPHLTTSRLILRRLVMDDAARIHELRSNPEVNRYLDRPVSTGIADAESYITKIEGFTAKRESLYWVINLKDNLELIGTVCLWNFDFDKDAIELGYELLPEFQGKGYMTEAIAEVIRFGFEQMGAKIITAYPEKGNAKSIAVLQKFNFALSDNVPADNMENMLVYVLNKDQFNQIQP